MTVDRLLGGIVALFGVFLLAYAIPTYVKGAPNLFDFPNPALFPSIAAYMFVFLGLMQTAFVKTRADLPGWEAFGLFLLIAGATLLAMILIGRLGYLPVAVALMAVVCFLTRERRPVWLVAVIVGMPIGTWLFFEQLLGRPLP